MVALAPQTAKPGPVTSLQARGAGGSARLDSFRGRHLTQKKDMLGQKRLKNKLKIGIGVVFCADSEFDNENSRGAHLGPVFDDFRFWAFCDFWLLSQFCNCWY